MLARRANLAAQVRLGLRGAWDHQDRLVHREATAQQASMVK
jgi:hypothetical protein